MCVEWMIRQNELDELLDEEIRRHRKDICFCENVREIALDVWKCEKRGKEVSRAKKVVVGLILDQAARNVDLILDDEVLPFAYLLNYIVCDSRALPKKWLPLVDYLDKIGV